MRSVFWPVIWAATVVFVLPVAAQDDAAVETPPASAESGGAGAGDGHDELGFPVTFGAETVTRRDIVRELGVADEEAIGSFRNARDRVLRDKLQLRIGELLGIKVTKEQVAGLMEREIEQMGGEARFRKKLLESGDTHFGYLKGIERKILNYFILSQLDPGTPGAMFKPLPYDLGARPSEILTAFRVDGKGRFKKSVQARWLDFAVDLSRNERRKVIVAHIDDPDAVEAAIEKKIRGKLDSILETLKSGVSFEEVAKAQGVDVETMKQWRVIPLESKGSHPLLDFVLGAEAGTTSPPFKRSEGGYRLGHLIEIKKMATRDLKDPDVFGFYRATIVKLKRERVQARLLLRALDSTTVSPDRVRADLRTSILSDLETAQAGLKALGLR